MVFFEHFEFITKLENSKNPKSHQKISSPNLCKRIKTSNIYAEILMAEISTETKHTQHNHTPLNGVQ